MPTSGASRSRCSRIPSSVNDTDGYDWIDRQGPVSPDLIEAIRESDHDLVAFTPYLYHPTVAGLPAIRERAVLHPAAHDEPAIRLRLFDDVFEAAKGLAFYTEGERAITEELFPVVVAKPQVVVGLGIDPPPGDSGPHGIAGLGSRPYLLVLGRVDHSKGTHLLASFFARYKQRRPGPLALAVVGPVQRPVPSHPDVVQVGEVDEATKWALLRGATALVSPSAFESFSLVLFESWEAGRPVLVERALLGHARARHAVRRRARVRDLRRVRGRARPASARRRIAAVTRRGRRPVRGAVPVAGRHRPLPAFRRAPRLYAARRCLTAGARGRRAVRRRARADSRRAVGAGAAPGQLLRRVVGPSRRGREHRALSHPGCAGIVEGARWWRGALARREDGHSPSHRPVRASSTSSPRSVHRALVAVVDALDDPAPPEVQGRLDDVADQLASLQRELNALRDAE